MIGGLLSLVRTLGLLVALASVFAAPTSWAATKTWNGSDSGSYSPPGNWMPTGLPGTSDAIVFANGTVGSTYDINFDADPTNTQLVVATNPLSFAGATRALSLTSTSTVESSRALIIGTTSAGGTSNAALTTSLGQLNTTYAVLGLQSGTNGMLNVTAGTFSVSGTAAFSDFLIGDSGAGTVNVSGGADVTVTGDTDLATFGASIGNISVTGSGSTWVSSGRIGFLKGTGTITVADGGTLSATGGVFLPGGTLTGNGTVTAAVSNTFGAVAPGATLGTLQINGSYTQGASGKLRIELGGTTAGTNYDRISVSGTATLAGTLEVTTPAFIPAQGNVFDILDFTTASGAFTTLTLPPPTGALEWNTSKLYTEGKMAVELRGDFNSNGVVDGADYAVWRKGLGTTYVAADCNLWRSRFGNRATSGAAAGASNSETLGASVAPEPGSGLLACLAGLATLVGRRLRALQGRLGVRQ